ncbi:hypothetical protein AALO_G00183650 [Alosa alosa]|uniref:Uncharacterized protein n=1 Tax=Alosa alosa TaxID=278164 RepID=A0AAV6G9N2_9TELE|nr:hypothetical protein AALO_G00183650 [Alosa alosa]
MKKAPCRWSRQQISSYIWPAPITNTPMNDQVQQGWLNVTVSALLTAAHLASACVILQVPRTGPVVGSTIHFMKRICLRTVPEGFSPTTVAVLSLHS